MVKRIESVIGALPGLPRVSVTPFSALKQAFREGYHWSNFHADLRAGAVVSVIALPLSMAFAIASGVPPQHGLYASIVAGALMAILGGSRVQVSGPTAAFVVVLTPVVGKFGLAGLAVASVMAGLILMLMGVLRLGRLIQFIPYPVTAGFTAGIAVLIATLQLKDLMGLEVESLSPDASYLEKVVALVRAMPTFHWPDLAIGLGTLAVMILWTRITRKVPAAMVGLALAAVAAVMLHHFLGDSFTVATIRSRFGTEAMPYGIPQRPPMPVLPWHQPGASGGASPALSFDLIRQLIPSAFAIAMLSAIASLLCAVVADGMSGTQHDPDAELLAQGTGNVVAPFFGGFVATGAIARTTANVRSGGRSPIAAVIHSVFVLLAVLALAPLLGYLPMAAMAALLLVVAWNMSEAKHFIHTIRVAPKSDVIVLLVCFSLMVFLDMTISVTVGVMLAALLFMRRMADFTGARLVGDHQIKLDEPLPKSLVIYEIAGPLFFGAAQKAMSELHQIRSDVRVVVMDLTQVPVMDATGLVNLESAVDKLYKAGIFVVLAGVQEQPSEVLTKAGWHEGEGRIAIFKSFNQGLATARALVQLIDDDPTTTLTPSAT